MTEQYRYVGNIGTNSEINVMLEQL